METEQKKESSDKNDPSTENKEDNMDTNITNENNDNIKEEATRSSILDEDESKSSKLPIIISVVGVLIIGAAVIFIIRKKKLKI
ncbi:hypothetical protein F9279_09180 [Bacillus sp. B1-b2]|nr:hypothetical protein F9279_09180 [Bacillus sp. B1-b2]